ncbi:MAG: serine/threonine protein kinase [Planctomycetes bacterium]|nr:serine/threonine protein kinase [Planctomycetota bacterium]
MLNRIGRGAGSTISLAIERSSRKRVVIKHVVREGPDDDRFLVQAENEYEVSHALDHPYLRRCYDLVRIRKWLKTRQLFLVMEYVDGEALEHQVPRMLSESIEIFIHVAEGLQAVHKHGYVHADMKPRNVLLAREGGLKIIDFGQSCPLGHRKERVQGTPAFMAPEQVKREPIDQRTDIFSLGASMYCVLTGKEFKTMMPTAPAAAKKIELESRRGSDPPHLLDPAIPIPLSRLIMECCETLPNDRPWDMAQVISRLELVRHLQEKEPGNAVPPRDSPGARGF